MKIGCIIQARMTSSRLPGKVALELPYNSNKSILETVINRVSQSKYITKTIVATTINDQDNQLVELCQKLGVDYYRGSENNVLERFYEACLNEQFDHVIRITSDCPFIDYRIIDQLVEYYLANDLDYASNAMERTYAHGLDCEIFKYDRLVEAYHNAHDPFETEHVTPYFYKTKKDVFKLGYIKASEKEYAPELRITVDTKQDYTLACLMFDLLPENFSYLDVLNLYATKPWIKDINSNIEQKKVVSNLEEELEEAYRLLMKQDLFNAAQIIKEASHG